MGKLFLKANQMKGKFSARKDKLLAIGVVGGFLDHLKIYKKITVVKLVDSV